MTRVRGLYAVIRYIPNLLRGEFVNVGVILVCPELRFQAIRVLPHYGKGSKTKWLEASDGHFVRHAMNTLKEGFSEKRLEDWVGLENVSQGIITEQGLNILALSYQNNIQITAPFAVAVEYPEVTLEKLFIDFVGQIPTKEPSNRVTISHIRQQVRHVFEREGLFGLGLQEDWVLPLSTTPKVDLAYQNYVPHLYKAISFAVDDEQLSMRVDAYCFMRRMALEQGDENLRNAEFNVLGYTPSKPSARVDHLLGALENEHIKVVNYTEVAELVPQIRQHLIEHTQKNVDLRTPF